jgi:branched-chain amino acid transport system ATP-binding protein
MLEISHLTVRFGGLTAVDDVSWRVGDGEIVGLVGPNGAGKTTLFNAISGLVRAPRGAIRFVGQDLGPLPVYARARHGVGRTFQIPQPMHALTVAQNVTVAQRFGAGRVDAAHASEVLALAGLTDKADADAATELSLTEWKALEVAKALATRPRLLLLDEVLAGLETAAKRAFTRMLAQIHERLHIAIVVIEHDIEAISTLCPRVAVLDFGRLIADGAPAEVFADPAVVASYTGGPAHA